jgi:hypothetical protein
MRLPKAVRLALRLLGRLGKAKRPRLDPLRHIYLSPF